MILSLISLSGEPWLSNYYSYHRSSREAPFWFFSYQYIHEFWPQISLLELKVTE
jgi:hypothetical protein